MDERLEWQDCLAKALLFRDKNAKLEVIYQLQLTECQKKDS